MEKSISIKLNEASNFLLKDISNTINNENDLKKYVKSNMRCISKLYGDEKFDFINKYIKNLISDNLQSEKTSFLVFNCNDGTNKRNFSFDMAQSFAKTNKKTLLMVFNSEKSDKRNRK